MRALTAFLFTATACGSSTPTSTTDAHQPPPIDAAIPAAGFKITIDQDFVSSAAVKISAATNNGVYAGYYSASSDFGSVPNLAVSIQAASADLATGSYPCARSTGSDPNDETAVTIQWLDGNTYYTNLQDPAACTVTVTAASQTAVAVSISGTIYNEMDPNHAASSFTASFTAMVVN